jgi:hypothetical protein
MYQIRQKRKKRQRTKNGTKTKKFTHDKFLDVALSTTAESDWMSAWTFIYTFVYLYPASFEITIVILSPVVCMHDTELCEANWKGTLQIYTGKKYIYRFLQMKWLSLGLILHVTIASLRLNENMSEIRMIYTKTLRGFFGWPLKLMREAIKIRKLQFSQNLLFVIHRLKYGNYLSDVRCMYVGIEIVVFLQCKDWCFNLICIFMYSVYGNYENMFW